MRRQIAGRIAAAVLSLSIAASEPAGAEASYLTGTIVDITSTTGGLMIRLDSGAPTNCVNSPANWMLISAADQVMASTVISFWLAGRKGFTVYVDPSSNTFCHVTQADPIE